MEYHTIEQNKAEQSKTEENRTEANRGKAKRLEQNRAEENRTGERWEKGDGWMDGLVGPTRCINTDTRYFNFSKM